MATLFNSPSAPIKPVSIELAIREQANLLRDLLHEGMSDVKAYADAQAQQSNQMGAPR